jgi:hypothetical protein
MTPPPATSDSAAFAAQVNHYITDYIKFADAKAGGILAVVSIVGTAVGVSADEILAVAHSLHIAAFAIGFVACGTAAVAVLLTLLQCVSALAPRIQQAPFSLSSFPDIARQSPASYATSVSQLTPQGIAEHYSVHNVLLSQIASKKFAALANATIWLRVALVAAYCATLIYGLSSAVTSECPDEHTERINAEPTR